MLVVFVKCNDFPYNFQKSDLVSNMHAKGIPNRHFELFLAYVLL